MKFKRAIALVAALMWVSVSVRADAPYVYGYLARTFDNGQTMCFRISDDGARVAKSQEPEKWNYSGDIDIPAEVRWNDRMFTVTGIESKTFADCPELESVHIPATVKYIWEDNFYEVPNLKSITVDTDSRYFTSIDGALYTKDGEKLLNYPPMAVVGEVKLPDSVRELGKWAFAYCTELRKFEFGPDIKTVGQYSFYKTGIEEIELPEGLEFTSSAALEDIYKSSTFANCTNLRKVVFHPNGLPFVPAYAFRDCNISEIIFPKLCDGFGEGAFSGNPFVEISMPYVRSCSLYPIRFECGSAFINCRQLKSLTLHLSDQTLRIKGNDSLRTIYLPEGVKEVALHSLPEALRDVYLGRNGGLSLKFVNYFRIPEEQKSRCTIHVEKDLEKNSPWRQIGTVVCDYLPSSVEETTYRIEFDDDEKCNVYTGSGNLIVGDIPYVNIKALGIKGMVIIRSLTTGKTFKTVMK